MTKNQRKKTFHFKSYISDHDYILLLFNAGARKSQQRCKYGISILLYNDRNVAVKTLTRYVSTRSIIIKQ